MVVGEEGEEEEEEEEDSSLLISSPIRAKGTQPYIAHGLWKSREGG